MTFDVGDPTFPVSNWTIQGLPDHGAVLVNFQFLSHSMQTPEQSDPGRNYVMTVEQARTLALAINRQVDLLDNCGSQTAQGTQH